MRVSASIGLYPRKSRHLRPELYFRYIKYNGSNLFALNTTLYPSGYNRGTDISNALDFIITKYIHAESSIFVIEYVFNDHMDVYFGFFEEETCHVLDWAMEFLS